MQLPLKTADFLKLFKNSCTQEGLMEALGIYPLDEQEESVNEILEATPTEFVEMITGYYFRENSGPLNEEIAEFNQLLYDMFCFWDQYTGISLKMTEEYFDNHIQIPYY